MKRWNRASIGRLVTVATAAMGALLLFGMPAAAGGGGCYGGATEGSSQVVALAQACPTPTVVHVAPGDTVRFVNKDEFVHNVIGVGFAWGHPDDLGQGDSFSQTFDERGVYPYACWYHPGMVGAVVVGDPGASATTSATGAVEPSSSPIAAEVTTGGSNTGVVLGWVLGGILGLALGIAIGVAVRRRGSGGLPRA